jgi:hypothetical protein
MVFLPCLYMRVPMCRLFAAGDDRSDSSASVSNAAFSQLRYAFASRWRWRASCTCLSVTCHQYTVTLLQEGACCRMYPARLGGGAKLPGNIAYSASCMRHCLSQPVVHVQHSADPPRPRGTSSHLYHLPVTSNQQRAIRCQGELHPGFMGCCPSDRQHCGYPIQAWEMLHAIGMLPYPIIVYLLHRIACFNASSPCHQHAGCRPVSKSWPAYVRMSVTSTPSHPPHPPCVPLYR